MSERFNDYQVKLNLLALSLPEAQTVLKKEVDGYMLAIWESINESSLTERIAQFEHYLLTGGSPEVSLKDNAPSLYHRAESIVSYYEDQALSEAKSQADLEQELGGMKLSRIIGLNFALNQYLMDGKDFIKQGHRYLKALSKIDTTKGKVDLSRLLNEDKLSRKVAGVVLAYGKKFAEIGLDLAVGTSSKADLLSVPGVKEAALRCFNRIGVMAHRFLSKIGIIKKNGFSKTRALYRFIKDKTGADEPARKGKMYAFGMSMAFVAGLALNLNFEEITQDLVEVKDLVIAKSEEMFAQAEIAYNEKEAQVCEISHSDIAALDEDMGM